jgi:hypothetical protein
VVGARVGALGCECGGAKASVDAVGWAIVAARCSAVRSAAGGAAARPSSSRRAEGSIGGWDAGVGVGVGVDVVVAVGAGAGRGARWRSSERAGPPDLFSSRATR